MKRGFMSEARVGDAGSSASKHKSVREEGIYLKVESMSLAGEGVPSPAPAVKAAAVSSLAPSRFAPPLWCGGMLMYGVERFTTRCRSRWFETSGAPLFVYFALLIFSAMPTSTRLFLCLILSFSTELMLHIRSIAPKSLLPCSGKKLFPGGVQPKASVIQILSGEKARLGSPRGASNIHLWYSWYWHSFAICYGSRRCFGIQDHRRF